MTRRAGGTGAGGALPLCASGAFTPEYLQNIEGQGVLHLSSNTHADTSHGRSACRAGAWA